MIMKGAFKRVWDYVRLMIYDTRGLLIGGKNICRNRTSMNAKRKLSKHIEEIPLPQVTRPT